MQVESSNTASEELPMAIDMTPTGQSLPRRERLSGRRNFRKVFSGKCSAGGPQLVVYVAPNDLDFSRVGIVVSRKLGNAVVRARVRRRIREAFRASKRCISTGIDFACIAKYGGKEEWCISPMALIETVERATKKLRNSGRG